MNKKTPPYWVACSGGIDSVFLVHLINQINIHFGILHCNFHLRGQDSDLDENFVRQLAKKLNLPIRVKSFNTENYKKEKRINTQLAARELRYGWFDEIIKNENAVILLAHHQDDQIETFLLQLRRGGSIKSLSAMPQFKNGYLRPLLNYKKKDIIDIMKKNNSKWREDKSNAENNYDRNYYRNTVIPFLEENNFPIDEIVTLVASFQKILNLLKNLDTPNKITFKEWMSFPIWYRQHLLSEHKLGEFPEKEITRLTQAKKGKFIDNQTATVWNEGNHLVFIEKNQKKNNLQLLIKKISFSDAKLNSDDLFLDASKITLNFSFRLWQAGDYFQPLGMKGVKKVSKFLRDRKIPAHQKENVYVLINEYEQILGIFGFGVSEKFKIEANTKEVIWVKLTEKPQKSTK